MPHFGNVDAPSSAGRADAILDHRGRIVHSAFRCALLLVFQFGIIDCTFLVLLLYLLLYWHGLRSHDSYFACSIARRYSRLARAGWTGKPCVRVVAFADGASMAYAAAGRGGGVGDAVRENGCVLRLDLSSLNHSLLGLPSLR